ncbi:hypothetical protein [Luteimonas aquatica]|uniref:hypothetical protein n=1 Tax=Luteimonas aquatica TaxID=450364 RepID=UPI001F585AC4|nr:hypothetical protein [Luteimonas aquatica]
MSEDRKPKNKKTSSALEAFRRANSPYNKPPRATTQSGTREENDEPDETDTTGITIGLSPIRPYVNFDAELLHWLHFYEEHPLAAELRKEDYEPAIKLGLDSYLRSGGRPLEEIRASVRVRYERTRNGSALSWKQAFAIIQDVWRRLA